MLENKKQLHNSASAAGKCRQVQASAGKCRQVQASAGKCRQVQARAGKGWQGMTRASKRTGIAVELAVVLRKLYDGAQCGDAVQVQALLAVLPSCETMAAYCALMAAVRNDHVNAVAAFAAGAPHMWTREFPHLLTNAACHGSWRVAAFLVAAKASVNRSIFVDDPIKTAARKGHLSCVSLLLAAKARICVQDGWPCSALQHAAEHGHADVVDFLLRAKADHRKAYGFRETPVYVAAAGMHEPALRVLLDAHADVNPPPPCSAPLIGACSSRTWPKLSSVFHLLLGARADVNATNTNGRTALSTAVANACPDAVVKLLLRAKADVNVPTAEGRTPLHSTAVLDLRSTARLLVRAKADVRAETASGCTAATLALNNNNFELAEYFEANAGV